MPEPKPRRSIFDTLKKSADGRLGLAEAARMADKISVFPQKRIDPSPDSAVNLSGQGSDQVSDYDPTPDPTPVGSGDPTNDPTGDPTIKKIIRGLAANKRRFLHFIIDNEPRGDDYIISRQTVARSLQLTEISVKRYFTEFADMGFFRKETYRHGICQGIRLFLVQSQCQAFKKNDPTHDPTDDPTIAPTSDPTPLNVDRKKENLSIFLSPERIATTWPNLARAGFSREQLNQIAQALSELGKSTDKVLQSLDHAEWELEQGKMIDKDGQPVADPCSWVFRSLARTGYYRRPKGYVSPEEQAAKDAEEEAKVVTVARQSAEKAQFEAWRDGLSPDELSDAMRGHPGGPKDAWLKSVWKKNNSIQ